MIYNRYCRVLIQTSHVLRLGAGPRRFWYAQAHHYLQKWGTKIWKMTTREPGNGLEKQFLSPAGLCFPSKAKVKN